MIPQAWKQGEEGVDVWMVFTEVVTGTQFLRFVDDLVAAWLAPSNLMEPPVYLVFILNAK